MGVLGLVASALDVDVLLVQEVPRGDAQHTLAPLVEHGFALVALPESTGVRNAVLTRLEAQSYDPIRYTVPQSLFDQLAAVAQAVTPAGRDVIVISAHLLWGGLAEPQRLQQADAIDQAVADRFARLDIPVVLGADMNCVPHSATNRFLTGLEPYQGRVAQWTDVWEAVADGPGVTSSSRNVWARQVATRHGFVDPSAMPDRRIDRVLVRGYAFGRPLSPLQAFVLDEHALAPFDLPFPPSDHWGVVADLWDPPH